MNTNTETINAIQDILNRLIIDLEYRKNMNLFMYNWNIKLKNNMYYSNFCNIYNFITNPDTLSIFATNISGQFNCIEGTNDESKNEDKKQINQFIYEFMNLV